MALYEYKPGFLKMPFLLCVFFATTLLLFFHLCWMEQLCYPEMPMFSLFGYGRKTSQYNSNFTHHWLRLNQARTNWQAILRPCKDQQSWVTVRQGWTNDKRSSASESFISHMDIQRSGHFSRIFIQSQTAKGKPKTFGGDSWRVYITGPANIAAHVFDHENGTYEAIALIMEAGKYTVHAYLDYSLCDGLRDPPKNWFNLGAFLIAAQQCVPQQKLLTKIMQMFNET